MTDVKMQDIYPTTSSSSSSSSSSSTSSSSIDTVSSRYAYVVTAQKPTVVTHTAVGNFTSPNEHNLIVCKCTRLEIYRLTSEGMESMLEVPLYGRISSMQMFRPKGDRQDRLLLTTERHKFCVLRYDSDTKELITLANGDTRLKTNRQCDVGPLCMIDPKLSIIGLHQYDGIFQVIPLEANGQLAPNIYDMKIDYVRVIQMTFLHQTTIPVVASAATSSSSSSNVTKPTIVILHQDNHDRRHLKSYTYDSKDKELKPGPFSVDNLDNGANWLIPVPTPLGGVLVVAEETISYYNAAKHYKSVRMTPCQVTAWGMVDMNRYLLGDVEGNLFMCFVKDDDKGVMGLHIEKLGVTTVAHRIAYLDNSYVFIGSIYGDSQLIKLSVEPNEQGSYVTVVDTFANLASIVDLDVMDLDRQGQCQLFTCSGAFKDATLRVIRNGIGIQEEASIELAGIKGVWALTQNSKTAFHKYLVQSFVSETRILAMQDEELKELEIPGFDSSNQTLFCSNMNDDLLVQVTPSAVHLVDANTLEKVHQWSPPAGVSITVAHGNKTQLLVATAGAKLILLNTQNRTLNEVQVSTLDNEVSCIDITPTNKSETATYAAIGMWRDMTVRVLSLPNLSELTREGLGGEIIPRSVLFAQFDEGVFLLVGLGDGTLCHYDFDASTVKLTHSKRIALGTKPISLTGFHSGEDYHVFAACDRPTVISCSTNAKLLYSNVNLKDVNYMSPFHAASFNHCLSFATEETLLLGYMDRIQRLHIKTIPLEAQARRIAYQQSSHTVGVAVTLPPEFRNGVWMETECFRLYDDQSFDLLGEFPFDPTENAANLASMKLKIGNQVSDCYVLGTAYVDPAKTDVDVGRLVILRVVDKKLQVVAQAKVRGAVYSLALLDGKILAGVNSKVVLYKLNQEDRGVKITQECAYHGNVLVIQVRTRGNFILVADLMKSVSLLMYKPATEETKFLSTIEEIARDHDANQMVSIEMINDELFVCAEIHQNLFSCRRSLDASTEEERARLEVVGRFHSGEMINKICPGSLVMNLPDPDVTHKVTPSHVFGTTNGVIGVIAPLTKPQYQFFSRLEEELEKVIKGVGGWSHQEWRSFSNDRRIEPAFGFVDGDLIESFLDLNAQQQQTIAQRLNVPLAEVTKRVEDASRIH